MRFNKKLIKVIMAVIAVLMLPIEAFASAGTVTADVLNVRTQPNANSEKLGVLYQNAGLNILENMGNGWLKIQYGQTEAYVSAEYVYISEAAPEVNGTVTASLLNIRQQPSLNGVVVAQAPMGAVLTILDTTDSYWFKVKYGTVEGYAASTYIDTSARHIYNSTSRNGYVDRTSNEALIEFAKQYLGLPYVYGGSTAKGFDCSGFTQFVFRNFGVTLPRTTYEQVRVGTYVSRDQLQMGDLVFFAPGGNINHVGIYISDGNFIHSTHTGDVLKISTINSGYYNTNFYCGRRVR